MESGSPYTLACKYHWMWPAQGGHDIGLGGAPHLEASTQGARAQGCVHRGETFGGWAGRRSEHPQAGAALGPLSCPAAPGCPASPLPSAPQPQLSSCCLLPWVWAKPHFRGASLALTTPSHLSTLTLTRGPDLTGPQAPLPRPLQAQSPPSVSSTHTPASEAQTAYSA